MEIHSSQIGIFGNAMMERVAPIIPPLIEEELIKPIE
jgi:hypothetical protein